MKSDRKIVDGKNMLLDIILILLFVVIMIILFFESNIFSNIKKTTEVFFLSIITIIYILENLTTFIHEHVHKVVANYYGFFAKPKFIIKKGFLHGWCHFCSEELIDKKSFIYISLAPFVFISAILLPIIFIAIVFNNLYVFILFFGLYTIKAFGCSLDFIMAYQVIKNCEKDEGMKYEGEIRRRFKIIKVE